MKKIKRIFGIALTMLLMAAYPKTAAADTSYTYTITYSNSNSWSSVKCYIWNTANKDDGSTYAGEWPGASMTYDSSSSSWTYTLTTTDVASALSVIFSDGSNSNNQTDDLSLSDYVTSTVTNNGDSGDSESSDDTTTTTTTSAAGNLYLVGDFLATDTENSAFKYSFRLDKQTDDNGSTYYSILIPATLSGVEFSLAMSNGTGYTYYGNSGSTYSFTSTNPAASTSTIGTASVSGYIVEDSETPSYYWSMSSAHANVKYQDGTYEFKVYLNANGVPSSWTMTHMNNLRVAYFVQSPAEKTNPVVQVAKMYSSTDGSYDDRYYGYFYLEKDKHGYVLANVYKWDDNVNTDLEATSAKLYSQGSYSDTYGVCDSEKTADNHAKVYPDYGYEASTNYNNKGFKISITANMGTTLEYNPTNGQTSAYTTAVVTGSRSDNYMGGELISTSKQAATEITSMSIIGDIVNTDWTTVKDMTYDEDEMCYYVTLTTTADEGTQNFRFIANGSWSNNWGEDDTKAKVSYDDTTITTGSAATEDDPNYVNYFTSRSDASNTGSAYDIIFNRPAGVWTIKFYIVTEAQSSALVQTYYYTITGEEGITISPMYCSATKEFICTYSNKEATNLQSGVKAYVAYRYDGTATKGSTDSTPEGTLYMRQMDYVPANVGVVLIVDATVVTSVTDPQNGTSYNFPALVTKRSETSATSEEEYPTVWTQYTAKGYSSDTWHNFLRHNTTGEVMTVGNADYDSSDKIIERRFGLSLYSKTANAGSDTNYEDYYGFFRFTSAGTIADGRAYLYLPVEDKGYGNLTYSGQILSDLTNTDETAESKGIGHMVFDDMEGYDETEYSSTTGITTIQGSEVRTSDNAFYTLQGIRVATPTRGIYIHNGKKVVIR